VDVPGSGSCPVMGFGISGVEHGHSVPSWWLVLQFCFLSLNKLGFDTTVSTVSSANEMGAHSHQNNSLFK